jgi:hypothetical protein
VIHGHIPTARETGKQRPIDTWQAISILKALPLCRLEMCFLHTVREHKTPVPHSLPEKAQRTTSGEAPLAQPAPQIHQGRENWCGIIVGPIHENFWNIEGNT